MIEIWQSFMSTEIFTLEMSELAKKRQESRLTFDTRSSDASKGSTPLYQAVMPLQLSPVCFTLQKQDGQIEEKV